MTIFPHEINDLTLPCATATAEVEVLIAGSIALKETLRSTAGQLRLTGLGDLALDYAQGRIVPLTLKVGGSVVRTDNVLPQPLNLGQSAETFCAQHFLSLGPIHRYTHPSASLQVSWIGTDSCTVTAFWLASASSLSGETITTTTHSPLPAKEGIISTVELSPRLFSGTGQLLGFEVKCGARRLVYHLLPQSACITPPRTLLVRNSFGAPETVLMLGSESRASKPDIQTARVGDALINYSADAALRITLSYGPLSLHDYTLPMLVAARSATLTPEGTALTLEAVKDEVATDPYTLQWGEATFRPTTDGIALPNLSRSRIFDDTYDDTFN